MTKQQIDIGNLLDIPISHFPDRSARWLLQDGENVRGLIEIVASELVPFLDFQKLTHLNRSFISDALREQESYLLLSVPFQTDADADELLIYILIEHQSTVDVAMGFRVLFYMMQIWDAQRQEWESENVPKSEWQLRPILPIVFYTGSQRWDTPLTLTTLMDIPEVLARFVPTYDTLFLGVKETDASELTQSDHPLGWLLTVLQNEDADTDSISEALRVAVSHLNRLDPAQAEQQRRAIIYLVLLILHRRPAGEREALITLVDRHAQGMEVETMAQTTAELLIEQGIEQGETRAKREAILKLLRSRFDTVPESVTARITASQNRSRLDSLFEKALVAESLDDID